MDFALTASTATPGKGGDFQGLSLLVCLPLLERGEGEGRGRGRSGKEKEIPRAFPSCSPFGVLSV